MALRFRILFQLFSRSMKKENKNLNRITIAISLFEVNIIRE